MSATASRPALDRSCVGLLPLLSAAETRPAAWDRGGAAWLSRGELRAAALACAAHLADRKKRLVFLFASNRIGTLVSLLGAAAAGHAVALLDPALPAPALAALLHAYAPDFILGDSDFAATFDDERWLRGDAPAQGLALWQRNAMPADEVAPIHPDLLLLLSTSGTTGSAKFVRLSARSITTNAAQIGAALAIDAASIAIAHLPLHYSYGLSVALSHLACGAAVYLTADAVTTPDFWSGVAAAGGTHLPGVPFHYSVLARLGIAKIVPASVDVFTQAGGALDLQTQRRIAGDIAARGGRFYVMYGQTEAAPRMTTLPSDMVEAKAGSVGRALAGGRIEIVDAAGHALPGDSEGDVVYRGPNVMLGYAENRADLACGEAMHGRLDTGDRGHLDADGYLFLTGRSQRFAKLFGLRVSLDDIEARLRASADTVAIAEDERILVLHESGDAEPVRHALAALATELRLPSSVFSPRIVAMLPRSSRGKIDYARVKELL